MGFVRYSFYLGRGVVRFGVGGFVVNEGVVHRKPVANHRSRLQTHHFLCGGWGELDLNPNPQFNRDVC